MTEGYYNKLKGRIYGLLCEKEKEGSWEKKSVLSQSD